MNESLNISKTAAAEDDALRVVHVMYLDDRLHEWLHTDTIYGPSGAKINYDTARRIIEYSDQGYALVKSDFVSGRTFRRVPSSDQIFTVHLCSADDCARSRLAKMHRFYKQNSLLAKFWRRLVVVMGRN